MFYYTYKIINKLNGKVYIGAHKTKNINDGYMGSGKALYTAYQKYGKENFEKIILELFESEEDMYSREKEIISETFVNEKTNYNMKIGGRGGWSYINDNKLNQSEELSVKRSNIMKQKWKEGYIKHSGGFPHTEETKKYLSKNKKEFYANGGEHPKGMLGKNHNDEVKKRISEKLKMNSSLIGKTGENHPSGGTRWFNNGTSHIRSKECPGPEWIEGRIFKKRNKRKSNESN